MMKLGMVMVVAAAATAAMQSGEPEPAPPLKEEQIYLEYTQTANEVAVVVQAESEERLDRVEVRAPSGALAFGLRAARGQRMALFGFVLESEEYSLEDLPTFVTEGDYKMHGRTLAGTISEGNAYLSLELPPAPVIQYPQEGAVGVPTNAVVGWVRNDEAVGYQVVLEQNENDGLTVNLPPESDSLRIPEGVLAPGTETLLEVATIGANGNRTQVEVVFTTW